MNELLFFVAPLEGGSTLCNKRLALFVSPVTQHVFSSDFGVLFKEHRITSSAFLAFLREWNVERLLGSAQKVLPHPSFVYCAQYHPTAQNLVVSGGYDSLVRVWRLDVDDVNGQLLQEFEGHNSFINTVCFDSEGVVASLFKHMNPIRK